LFFGTLVNYIDRGTIAILAHHLQGLFRWKESDYGWIVFAFQFAYAIMMLGFGGIIDRVGTRVGYALAMTWWSLAAMGHALARGVWSFAAARFLLGAGEAGNFPASIKAIAEWFPKRERALATGIFNSAAAVGTVVAYPLVGWLFLKWGWQAAFIGTGALGLVCLAAWLGLYRLPRRHFWLTPKERAHIETEDAGEEDGPGETLSWRKILSNRKAWGFTLAKFMTDPIWWFYIFWLPKYLIEVRHFSIAALSFFGTVPWVAAVPGSIGGGWLSGFLLARGHPGGLCPQSLVGARFHLRGHCRAPRMVSQCLHAGVRHVREGGRRVSGGIGRCGRRRGRNDHRARRRLHLAMVPHLCPPLHHRRGYAPAGDGCGPLAPPAHREGHAPRYGPRARSPER
jgi:ACS family hexuronate transporter-like MFS transporter